MTSGNAVLAGFVGLIIVAWLLGKVKPGLGDELISAFSKVGTLLIYGGAAIIVIIMIAT